jgi:hypothetical protein
MYSLQGHSGPVNACEFSNDGSFFATGGADQLVMVWKSNLDRDIEPPVEWGMPDETKMKNIPKVTRTRPSAGPSSATARDVLKAQSPSLKGLLLTQSKPMPEQQPQGPGSPNAKGSAIPVPKRIINRTATASAPAAGKKSAYAYNAPPTPPRVASSAQQQRIHPPTPPPASASASASAPVESNNNNSNSNINSNSNNNSNAAIEHTLGRILGQLDLVTKTIISMENRLTINEDRLTNVIASRDPANSGNYNSNNNTEYIEAGAFDEDDD